jgi:peptide/nickel transport system permease protein
MGRFVLRRLAGVVVVLFAVSVLVFLIFNVIPNGDPAQHIAGRTSTPTEVAAIRRDWGFDRSVFVPYATTMKKVFTGDLVSYYNGLNVDDEIRRGFPRTLALALGAALIWMAFAVALSLYSAIRAGSRSDRLLTALALVGISTPVFWLGALANYYLGFKLKLFPNGGQRGAHGEPAELAVAPDLAVDRARGRLHRLLLAGTARQRARHARRGVRARRARQGPVGAQDPGAPRAAQLADPDRDAVGARPRRGDRRRRGAHGDGVRHPGGVGQYFADSVGQLDLPLVLAVTMFGAFFVVFLNAIVDILYAFSTQGSASCSSKE